MAVNEGKTIVSCASHPESRGGKRPGCSCQLTICAALSSNFRFSSSVRVPSCSFFWISSYTSLRAYALRTVETVWFRMWAVDRAAWNQPPTPNGIGPVEAR